MSSNPPIDDSNGKSRKKVVPIPQVMQTEGNQGQILEIAKSIKNEINATKQQTDLSKYLVMQGMQDPDKRQFFTEYLDFDDVLRMDTIERYVDIAPLIIRKCSPKTMTKIEGLMQKVYQEHVEEHKENMSALKRGREQAYVRILSAESSDSGVAPTGLRKFFGLGVRKQ